MTDRSFASQLPSRARIGRLDIVGGGRFAGLLLALAVFAVAMDGWGLHYWHVFAGYTFRSGIGGTGSGGKFALVFIAIYAVFFVVAQTFFARSLWLGWIVFALCLLLQTAIAFRANIIAFKAYLSTASAQNAISGTILEWGVEVWSLLSNLLHARYFAIGQAYPNGISEPFAASVVLNSLVLVGSIGLAVLLGLAFWLIGRLARAAGWRSTPADTGATDRARIQGYIPLAGAARTIAVHIGAVALLFAASGPMIAMVLPGSIQNTEEVQNILWIGPLVVMLELARLALYDPQKPTTSVATAEADPASKRWIPVVHDHLLSGMSRGSAALHIPAGSGGIAAAQTAVAASPEALQPGELRYFLETLTPLHFQRLSALLASAALDRGRSALIICPADAKAEVRSRFQMARTPAPVGSLTPDGMPVRGLGEIWVDLARPPDRATTIDVLVVSPDEIEDLLLRRQHYQADLARLGTIFVLNLHLMDLGQLSLGLRRLHAASRHSADLVYIAQSEPFVGQADRIQHLLPLVTGIRQTADLDVPGKTDRYISVWPAMPSDSISDPNHWPVTVQAVRLARQVSPAVNPYLWDARGSFVQSHWRAILPPLLAEQNQSDLIAYAQRVEPARLGPPAGQHPLAVISAPDNLADALALGIGNGHSPDAGAVIVVSDYPLARFHFEQFQADVVRGPRDEIGIRQALRTFRATYASIAPRPRIGPVELALTLANEFLVAANADPSTQDGWLPQSAIAGYWQGESADVLHQLQINSTKTGLVRLFEICVGQTIRIEQQRHVTLVRRYKVENPRQIEGATLSLMQVRTQSFLLPDRLPEADHGLAYADGTHLVVGAALYRVTEVDPAGRTVWLREADGEVPRYVFVRSYAILRVPRRGDDGADESQHDIAVELYAKEANRRVRFEMASGYLRVARRTAMAYRYANPQTPFSSPDDGPREQSCDALQPPKLRSASLLRLYSDGLGGRRPAAGNRGGNRQDACVAFTLVSTLQDTLASLFPAHAHRIAVVSPQAATIAADISQGGPDLPLRTTFALARQPVLSQLDARLAAPETDARCRIHPDAVRAYEAYFNRFFKQARALDASGDPPGVTCLASFLIVEDCDHDLGIARVVVEERERVFRIWAKFLEHCVMTQSTPNDCYYAFHSGQVSDVFQFQAALDIVANLGRN